MNKKKPIRNIFQNSEVAKSYDNFYQEEAGKAIDEIERKLLLEHLSKIPYRDMLELGCGTGHWTGFFCEHGFRVTAVDESESMLKIAEEKNPDNCRFLKADATKLPFSKNSFSVITSVTMIEFVENVSGVLDEIARILKPGGSIILGSLNENSELGRTRPNDHVFQHARFFTPGQIQKLLKRFGEPKLSYGVYLSPDFEILDGTEKQNQSEPAFIAASVQKIK